MATGRVVNTGYWKDSYVIDLKADEKLLFIYLLTNSQTNIAGIYEISLREVAFDTSLEDERVQEIVQKFTRDGKITYINGWLALHNWTKNQSINPKVKSGIARIVYNLPPWLQQKLIFEEENAQANLLDGSLHIDYDSLKTVDNLFKSDRNYSLSKPIVLNLTKLNLTKLNLTKLNLTAEADGSSEERSKSQKPSGAQYRKAMEADDEQQGRAKRSYTRKPSSPGKVSQDEIDKAYDRRTIKR